MKIETLLFPTKFRAGAFEFLEKLLILKEVGLKKVLLLHVISLEEVAFDLAGYLKDIEIKLKENAERRMEQWMERLKSQIEVEKMVVVGVPEYEILEVSKSVDMVGVAKPKTSYIKRLFFGSTTLKFLAEMEKPSIVAKTDEGLVKDNRSLFEKVVFAVDGSEPCVRAREILGYLKPILGEVHVVCVFREEQEKERFGRVVEEFSQILRSSGIQKVEGHLLRGTPSQSIVKFCHETDATLTVLGTTGKDRFEDLMIGSVSHRVLEKSKSPVMLVP